MARFLLLVASLFAGATVLQAVAVAETSGPPDLLTEHPREYMEALQVAVSEHLASLAETRVPKDISVAVVGVGNDPDSRFYELLKAELSKSGYKLYERRDDEWERLVREIEVEMRNSDILDPTTIQKFGRFSGVSAVVYGRLMDAGWEEGRARVTCALHLSEVETGRHIWGHVATAESSLPPAALLFVASHWKVLAAVVAAILVAIILGVSLVKATTPK